MVVADAFSGMVSVEEEEYRVARSMSRRSLEETRKVDQGWGFHHH
jgi:hypothetical protein